MKNNLYIVNGEKELFNSIKHIKINNNINDLNYLYMFHNVREYKYLKQFVFENNVFEYFDEHPAVDEYYNDKIIAGLERLIIDYKIYNIFLSSQLNNSMDFVIKYIKHFLKNINIEIFNLDDNINNNLLVSDKIIKSVDSYIQSVLGSKKYIILEYSCNDLLTQDDKTSKIIKIINNIFDSKIVLIICRDKNIRNKPLLDSFNNCKYLSVNSFETFITLIYKSYLVITDNIATNNTSKNLNSKVIFTSERSANEVIDLIKEHFVKTCRL